MIYSHKTDGNTPHLSLEEKQKLKQLMRAKRTAWMIDDKAEYCL